MSLNRIVVAWDGLAIIVHPENRVTGLSSLQVREIFSGQIREWTMLGGAEKRITIVTREEGSGTRGAFQELIMDEVRISSRAIVQDSNGTVREIVARDPQAIGYISLGFVDSRVRALALDGIVPNEDAILNNRYPIVRPFLFVTRGVPSGAAKDFIDFVLSVDGQDLIKKEGLLSDHQVTRSL
jgi:phosphate transport system substrate-binding protein